MNKPDWIPKNKTHGLSDSKFYRAYYQMKGRCENKKLPSYEKYGKKGIQCLWQSFLDFKDDMYDSFLAHIKEHGEKNTTIDRIDSSKSYCKKNCRWATYDVQNRNRATIRFVTINGVSKCVSDWAKEYKIDRDVIYDRYLRYNWDIVEAITTPKHVKP